MNFVKFLTGAAIALVVIQFIPYGRDHKNPPITGEPKWDSPKTKELFNRACKDCHSNETVWPWYSSVAPVSWLTALDVSFGRGVLNVSEWGRPGKNEGDKSAEEVKEGKMPLFIYLPAHPEAKLNAEDKQALINGLVATFGEKKTIDKD
ncbi:MAG: heme-binding domain-containing protein [Chlorobiales bacterium]|nr:heme-binding domain-containing protein [Chlorobiales bacterium]